MEVHHYIMAELSCGGRRRPNFYTSERGSIREEWANPKRGGKRHTNRWKRSRGWLLLLENEGEYAGHWVKRATGWVGAIIHSGKLRTSTRRASVNFNRVNFGEFRALE